MTDFLFLGSNLKSLQMVTAAMKLAIASWQENGDKSGQCVEKHRHDSADKGLYSQAMVFSVVMYGCEILTIKKVECQRIDAFKLWCYRRLLKVPWIARRSKQSFFRKIIPQYSLEGLILMLQYFGHLM